MTDYLAYATTATGVPITECEVCGQRHPERRFGPPVRYSLGVDNESAPEALERSEGLATSAQPSDTTGGSAA